MKVLSRINSGEGTINRYEWMHYSELQFSRSSICHNTHLANAAFEYQNRIHSQMNMVDGTMDTMQNMYAASLHYYIITGHQECSSRRMTVTTKR